MVERKIIKENSMEERHRDGKEGEKGMGENRGMS